MEIGLVGINYRSAPVSLRERVAAYFTHEEMNLVTRDAGVAEGAILTTCNRTEVIFSSKSEHFSDAQNAVLTSFSRSIEQNSTRPENESINTGSLLYKLRGADVPSHVYTVATGLDSMIIGETQILSQLKKSYAGAVKNGWVGATLHRLFQSAFHAAKRIRSSTGIGRGTLSVAYAARQAVKGVFGDLADRKILIIGAGETAHLICKHLYDDGIRSFFIANRTSSRGSQLAESFNGVSIPLSQIAQIIPLVDIIVTAVDGSSGSYLVTKSMINGVLASSSFKNICLLDLSVPRAIEPSIAQIESAYLFDIDDFGELIADNLAVRTLEAERARLIIDEESHKFIRWQAERETRKALSKISDELLNYGRDEIRRLHPKLAELVEFSHHEESIQSLMLTQQRNAVKRFLHPYFEKLELPEFLD